MIQTARHQCRVRTEADYRQLQLRQAQGFARLTGEARFALREAGAIVAYVNHGRWVGDCACGSGVSLDPTFATARCMGFGCGAVYRDVVWPADREAIEAVLSLRRTWASRNWLPGETVADLIAENRAHGAPVPEGA